MSGETWQTVRGRLTADPEMKFTQSGAAVVSFKVASNASKLNRQTNAWEDKPTKFWRCQAWSQGRLARAENIADILKKGDAVVVYGELETREFTTKEGEKRSMDEIRVEAIGKDLTFHGQPGQAARPSNAQQSGYVTNNQPNPGYQQQSAPPTHWQQPQGDTSQGWGTAPSEPPF